MLYSLAQTHNIVIKNWPEDVLYPKLDNAKSMAVLWLKEQHSLLRALTGKATYPLEFIQNHNANRNLSMSSHCSIILLHSHCFITALLTDCSLVIIYALPAPISLHCCTLYMWFFQTLKQVWIDREGPA